MRPSARQAPSLTLSFPWPWSRRPERGVEGAPLRPRSLAAGGDVIDGDEYIRQACGSASQALIACGASSPLFLP